MGTPKDLIKEKIMEKIHEMDSQDEGREKSFIKPRPRVPNGEPDPDKERILELKEKCARCNKRLTTTEHPVVVQRRLHHTKTGYEDYLPALKGHVCHTCADTAEKATKALQKLFKKEQEEAEQKELDKVLVCCSDCGEIHKLRTPCPICRCETIKGMKMAKVTDMDVVVIEIPTKRFQSFLDDLSDSRVGDEAEEFTIIGRALEEE